MGGVVALRFAACAVVAELALLASAAPAPTPVPGTLAPFLPVITTGPSLDDATKTINARGFLSDLASGVDSVLGSLGSAIPSYVASGIPNFFQDFPTGDKVKSSLGVDDSQLATILPDVLNIPPYGNWTNNTWHVRFHGNVYKQPPTNKDTLDSLANKFLIGVDIKDLPEDQQNQARNLTAEIFVVQQADQNVTMHLEPAPAAGSSGEKGGGGAETPDGGSQSVKLPDLTTSQGDFDAFVPIKLNGLKKGDDTKSIQRLNVYANGSNVGNATAYLVPPKGITFISDIDDILRVTKIYNPKEGLLNSFARAFTPWRNMPDIYANWSRSLPDAHFHYLTTTPEQVTRNYMDFIYKTYPGGSFDTRPLNFSDVSATLSIRKFLLTKIFQTFPQRKFVLVGDTSNSDIMKDYPGLAQDFPGQVQCIFLRNTSATDNEDKFPYDTKEFKNLNTTSYMFFLTPDDLTGLDIEGGNCLNRTVRQNVTFGMQDELLGIHGDDSAAARYKPHGVWVVMTTAIALVAGIAAL